jgi:hypothetical protein
MPLRGDLPVVGLDIGGPIDNNSIDNNSIDK